MSSTQDNTELESRIYDYIAQHYNGIEKIPPSDVFVVVQLWSEFVNSEIRRAQVDARIDEIEHALNIWKPSNNSGWNINRGVLQERLKELKSLRVTIN